MTTSDAIARHVGDDDRIARSLEEAVGNDASAIASLAEASTKSMDKPHSVAKLCSHPRKPQYITWGRSRDHWV